MFFDGCEDETNKPYIYSWRMENYLFSITGSGFWVM